MKKYTDWYNVHLAYNAITNNFNNYQYFNNYLIIVENRMKISKSYAISTIVGVTTIVLELLDQQSMLDF